MNVIQRSLASLDTYLNKNKLKFNNFCQTLCRKIDDIATPELRKEENYKTHVAGW